MSFLDKLFKKRTKQGLTAKRPPPPMTEKRLQGKVKSAALEAMFEEIASDRELALNMGKQIMKYKEPDRTEQLIAEEAERNPEFKQKLLEKALNTRGIRSGGNWMDEFERHEAFFDRMRGGQSVQKPNILEQTLTALLSNPQIIEVAAGMLSNRGNGGQTSRKQISNGHVAESDDNIEEEQPDMIQGYIDTIMMMIGSDKEPEIVAQFAMMELNDLAVAARNGEVDKQAVERIRGILYQPENVLAIMLQSMANLSLNEQYIGIAQKLQTADGHEYMRRFCEKRDSIIAEHAK